jgi:3-deoxy-manno-octulosonate cytidylyltransferase (CMP-KDO synthetase)
VHNPNAVKVVTDARDRALYFSRAAIPYCRDYATTEAAIAAGIGWKRHLGLYAYRPSALRRFTACSATPLEKSERLEQLRIMEQGGRIAMARACEFIPAGIDTADDLQRAQEFIASKN